jgi:hypothetical protein
MLGSMTLLLTGCVRLGIDLQVNKDKTISGTMIFALSDSLAALGGSSTSLNQGGLIDAKTKGVTVRAYAKDGYTGEEYDLKNVPISAFKPKGADDSFSITETAKQITVNGYMDLSDTGSTDSTDSQLTSSMFATADIHVSIKFPYDVTSSTGEISADKRTVTWRPKIGGKTQLQTVVDIPSASYVTYIAGGIIAIIILTLLGYFLARRRKKRIQLSFESETNDQDLNPKPDYGPDDSNWAE